MSVDCLRGSEKSRKRKNSIPQNNLPRKTEAVFSYWFSFDSSLLLVRSCFYRVLIPLSCSHAFTFKLKMFLSPSGIDPFPSFMSSCFSSAPRGKEHEPLSTQ